MTVCVTWMPRRGLARTTEHHSTRWQSIPAQQSVVGDEGRMKYGISSDSNMALTRVIPHSALKLRRTPVKVYVPPEPDAHQIRTTVEAA